MHNAVSFYVICYSEVSEYQLFTSRTTESVIKHNLFLVQIGNC